MGAESLHSPSLLTDLDRGVDRLERAIRERDKIVVFGDYDVDGVTSTALLLDYLARVDASFDYVLPDRHQDGYGLKPAGVRRALEKGARLIVLVDQRALSKGGVRRRSGDPSLPHQVVGHGCSSLLAGVWMLNDAFWIMVQAILGLACSC